MSNKYLEWYENGKNYNRRLEPNYYDLIDCNWDFFYGKQWRNADVSSELPQPVFNNINRFITFFVASIMAGKPSVHFDFPMIEEDSDAQEIVNQSWKEFEERVKLVWQTKNALYDGAVTGDYVAHLFMNPNKKPYNGLFGDVMGEIEFQLIDPNNFYVSNPNSCDVQSQKYVQIVGRDLIYNLKKEAEDVAELIKPDDDTEEQASRYGRIELEGNDTEKATYILTYERKEVTEEIETTETDEEGNETTTKTKKKRQAVVVTKTVGQTNLYEQVDTGLDLFPVAHSNWELRRNTYHGFSFVEAAIPAQIYINRAFAMAMYNTMTTAFPKFLHDERISGVSNMIGGALKVQLRPGESIRNIADYIAPGNMSPQVMQMIDMAQTYMQETVGANDALLGNINPEQASGVSVVATSKQAGIPLENPKSNLYNWLEDIGRIYLDMISNLYGERAVIMQTEDGAELVEFDFESLKGMFKHVSVDVGSGSYWSELATVQTLDNLLDRQLIEFIEYLERMPEGYIPDKQGLISKIKEANPQLEEVPQMDIETFRQTLTPEELEVFDDLTPEEQEQVMLERMVVQNEV